MAKAKSTPSIRPAGATRQRHSVTATQPSRRVVLAGVAAAAVTASVGPAAAAPSAREKIDIAANDLKAALYRLHGGEWAVTIDHENQFVLVSRKPEAIA